VADVFAFAAFLCFFTCLVAGVVLVAGACEVAGA